jgi:hypothetical protein
LIPSSVMSESFIMRTGFLLIKAEPVILVVLARV